VLLTKSHGQVLEEALQDSERDQVRSRDPSGDVPKLKSLVMSLLSSDENAAETLRAAEGLSGRAEEVHPTPKPQIYVSSLLLSSLELSDTKDYEP